jgi:RNA polymerase sigma-70 factor (ECF subfamily)
LTAGPVSNESVSDAELVGRALRGDDGAFRVLVERYESAVASTVIGMLGPGDEADDVGQETFIRFYRSMKKYRGDASLKTYLTRIAINLSLNALKRRRGLMERFVSRDQATAPPPEPALNGVGAVESRETKEAVQHAIQQLNPKHRTVVVLRMIDGYSTKETAEILGIPAGTVLSRLARAMDALKPMLRPYASGHET